MDLISRSIGSISQSVKPLTDWAGITQTPEHTFTKEETAFLEEQERARRVSSASSSQIDRENAKNVSTLFDSVSFPVFRGNTSQGYKRVTRKIEEIERERRAHSKPESTLRRLNANKSAGVIRAMGWPFYRQNSVEEGPEYIMVDETRLMEEEEREQRISNPAWALQAKNNGALVSNLMRWEWDNSKYHTLGMKRWSRNAEEKERTRRLNDKTEMETSIINAYNSSSLIRGLGWPFFAQEESKQADITLELEEKERKYRLSHPEEQQLAREIAGRMFEPLQDTGKLAEKERTRRMQDADESRAAIDHARQVSSLISRDTARMEEEERVFRLQNSESDRKNARRVAHLIDGLCLTSSGVSYLEEKERKRRVNNAEWQTEAVAHTRKIASMLGENFAAKNFIDSVEENERNERMWNKSQQLTAMKNARMVSRMILNVEDRWAKTSNIEEQERSRRMMDRTSQLQAFSNAQNISRLISGNSFDSSAVEEEERERRMSDASHEELARSNASKIASMISSTSEPRSYEERSLPHSAPADFNRVTPLAEPILPIPQEALLASVPAAAVASTRSPSTRSLLTGAPVTSAPTQYIMAPPVRMVSYGSPASSYAHIATPPPTTILPATGLQLHALNDKGRKRLEKQAGKQSKLAQKESDRAQKSLAKAEKYHLRGKESRAMRHEGRAEKHTVAAKHHQLWSDDLTKDVYSATHPAVSMIAGGGRM